MAEIPVDRRDNACWALGSSTVTSKSVLCCRSDYSGTRWNNVIGGVLVTQLKHKIEACYPCRDNFNLDDIDD
jgi:hypothetical protein